MRIVPIALIALGVFGVLKHFGLIDPAFVHLFWPLLLIGIGLVMLARGPLWRAGMHDRMQDRWERRMHRHFGPGWNRLSEAERERFRAGMRQRQTHADIGGLGGIRGDSSVAAPESADSSPKPTVQPPAPGAQR